MNCKDLAPLLSKALDGELSSRESRRLEKHLRSCERCRQEQLVWSKYEHKMSRFYGSHRLGETFVARVHAQVASLPMESPHRPRPHISGIVQAMALRWLQPVGLAAALLLATLLFALRTVPSLGELLDGTGFLSSTGEGAVTRPAGGQHPLQPGDLVWTQASQWLRMRLSGTVSLLLAERGILSFEGRGWGRDGVARLHTGKVQLGSQSGSSRFVLNTDAGAIRGEAGRVDVTARWVPLTQKSWKSSTSAPAWVEGWRAVPLARVDVSEGRAEVAGSKHAAGLVSGQSAAISTALEGPVLTQGQAVNPIPVIVEPLAGTGQPQIRSQLLQQGDQVAVETTFVQIPLRTVLSSLAEVPESHIEMAAAAAVATKSLRVVRSVDSSPEAVLEAVAHFSGLATQKELRTDQAQILELAPELWKPVAAAVSQLTVEMDGDSMALLKGSGVRLSTLSKALQEPLGTTVEPASVDWSLGEFELHNVPRDKIPEALSNELHLQVRQQERPAAYYRFRPEPGRTSRPAAGSGAPTSGIRSENILPQEDSVVGERSLAAIQQHPAFAALSEAEQKNWARSLERLVRDARSRNRSRAASAGAQEPDLYGELADWLAHFVSGGGDVSRQPLSTVGLGPGSHLGTASGNNSSTQLSSTGVAAGGHRGIAKPPEPDWNRTMRALLEDWAAARQEFSQHLVFSALPASSSATLRRLDLAMFSITNAGSNSAWIHVDLRTAQGEILDSSYLEIAGRGQVTVSGTDLFPGFADDASASYVEAEAQHPIAGSQLVVENSSPVLFPAQPVSGSLRYFAPFVTATTGGEADTVLKLINAADSYQNVRVSVPLLDGTVLEPVAFSLAPHSSKEISLRQLLVSDPIQTAAFLTGGLWIDTDQPGLVGQTWSRAGSESAALTLQQELASEWRLSSDSRAVRVRSSANLYLALMNPQETAAALVVELWSGRQMVSLQTLALAERSTQLITLPDMLAAPDVRIVLRSSVPVSAAVY